MNSADYKRFSSAVLAIHECQEPDALGRALVSALGLLCEADSQHVTTLRASAFQVFGGSAEVGLGPLTALNAHFAEHPLLRNITQAAEGGASIAGRWSDFISLRSFRQKALYHDCFRVLDVQHQVAAVVRVNGEVALGLSMHRGRGDFCAEEVQMLQWLLPHVKETTRRMIGQREIAAALEFRESSIGPEAVIIIDERGTMLYASERASQLLRHYFRGDALDGLPPEVSAWLRGQPAPGAKFTRELPGRRLVCTAGSRTHRRPDGLAPFPPAGLGSRFLQRLSLTEFNEKSACAHLRERGLTHREAEVLHWIAEGKRNSEIAIILAISERTVEKHGENVFVKLGVETRTAAVACYHETLRFSPL